MATVNVTDIFTRVREVELPDACGCGADLTDPGALHLWEWNEAVWSARLPCGANGIDEIEQGGVLVDGASSPEFGEDWIPHVAYYCASCGTNLAEGEHRELEEPAPPNREVRT